MDRVAFFKRQYNFIHKGVARVAAGHDQVYCQRIFGGAQPSVYPLHSPIGITLFFHVQQETTCKTG